MALNKPPINTTADSIAGKGWLNDLYTYTQSGILIPGGGSQPAPISSSRRNLVVNGDMMISQRGPVVGNGFATSWGMDRWAITNAAPFSYYINQRSMQGFISNPLAGFDFCISVDCASGNTQTGTGYVAQAIESAKIIPVAGQPFVFSYWVYGGPSFSPTYWANQTFLQSNGSIIGVVQTGTGINEGTFAAFTGSNYIANTGVTPIPGYWTYVKTFGTFPKNAKEAKVYFQIGKTSIPYVTNAWFAITGVQLEIGTTATAFDKIPFDQSLLECQRFYEKSFDYAIAPAQNTGSFNGCIGFRVVAHTVATQASVYIPFKVRKVQGPVISFYSPKALSTNWWNVTQAISAGASNKDSVGEYGFIADETQISGEAVGNLLNIHYDATADF
jgi:hypothetical protein